MNEKKKITLKGSKKGAYIAAVSVIVIALVIIMNLIVGQLPSNQVEIDISGSKLYEVSAATEKFLAELTDDIEITVIAQEQTLDERVSKAIAGYAGASSHISYTVIDPVKNPSVLDKYEVGDGYVIVTNLNNGKSATVAINGFDTEDAMLKYDSMSYYYYQQLVAKTLDVDGQLTSAINIITNESAGKAYMLTNHGESTLSDAINERIKKLNIDQADLNLLKDGAIPDDCRLLVSYNPTTDMTKEELSLIVSYLTKGGHVMIIIDACDLTNYNALINSYGLMLREGYVGDMTNYYQTYAQYYGYYCIAPEVSGDSPVTSGISADAIVVYSRGMQKIDASRISSSLDTFLTTSDKAFMATEDTTEPEPETLVLGAVATEDFDTDSDGTADATSRLTVISAVSLIDESITSAISSISNLDIFMNAFSQNFDGASSVVVPSRSLELSNNNMEGLSFLGIFFIAIIPLAILVIGFAYWSSRRKK